MNQADQINQEYDLLTLVEGDTNLRRSGSGWWAGPCPFCGGVDRFALKSTPAGWRWFCRKCGGEKYHTPIDYVMRRRKCGFREAVGLMGSPSRQKDQQALGGKGEGGKGATERAEENTPLRATERAEEAGEERPNIPLGGRGEVWQERGKAWVAACEESLWSPVGVRAREWLMGRGLKEASLRKYHIGLQAEERFEPLGEWGLVEPEDGARHALWLPRGIVLPCLAGGELWYAKVRRPLTSSQVKQGEAKYVKLKGSRAGLFGAENLADAFVAVLTEGELDCVLLDQEAGELVRVASLGSASDRISRLDMAVWDRWVLRVGYFLLAYDRDAAGEQGLSALTGYTRRAVRLSLPKKEGVKDVTDYFLSGGDLREWLEQAIGMMQWMGQLPALTVCG